MLHNNVSWNIITNHSVTSHAMELLLKIEIIVKGGSMLIDYHFMASEDSK